jgi:hypothetical protein
LSQVDIGVIDKHFPNEPSVTVPLVPRDHRDPLKGVLGKSLLGAPSKRLSGFRCVDPGKAHFMLHARLVQYGQGVAVMHRDYEPLKRIGSRSRPCPSEQQQAKNQ